MNSLRCRLAVGPESACDEWRYFCNLRKYRGYHTQQLLARETLEQFIVERNDRLVAAGITLASCSSKQLAIDAARLVILGQNDVQATGRLHRGMQSNVGAAAGH